MAIARGGEPASSTVSPSVFLNLPFDSRFERLFVAYIASVASFGLTPRAALETYGSKRRLDRICKILSECRYSIHDLSGIQLDRRPPATPHFNIPFELGLAVAQERAGQGHTLIVFEQMKNRIAKSLSDLDGTEVCIHDGKINGVFSELCNALSSAKRNPTSTQMRMVYRHLRQAAPVVLRRTDDKTLFKARPFRDLCVIASDLAHRIVT